MILFLAGGMILAAFAALVAQMGLFLRTSRKQTGQEKGAAVTGQVPWQSIREQNEIQWGSGSTRYPASSHAQLGMAEQQAKDSLDVGW